MCRCEISLTSASSSWLNRRCVRHCLSSRPKGGAVVVAARAVVMSEPGVVRCAHPSAVWLGCDYAPGNCCDYPAVGHWRGDQRSGAIHAAVVSDSGCARCSGALDIFCRVLRGKRCESQRLSAGVVRQRRCRRIFCRSSDLVGRVLAVDVQPKRARAVAIRARQSVDRVELCATRLFVLCFEGCNLTRPVLRRSSIRIRVARRVYAQPLPYVVVEFAVVLFRPGMQGNQPPQALAVQPCHVTQRQAVWLQFGVVLPR